MLIANIFPFTGFITFLVMYRDEQSICAGASNIYHYGLAEDVLFGLSIAWALFVNLRIIDNPKLKIRKQTKGNLDLLYFMTWFNAKIGVLIWANTFIYSSDALSCKNDNFPNVEHNPNSMYKYVFSFVVFGYAMMAYWLYLVFKISYMFWIRYQVKTYGFYEVVKPGSSAFKDKTLRSVALAIAI